MASTSSMDWRSFVAELGSLAMSFVMESSRSLAGDGPQDTRRRLAFFGGVRRGDSGPLGDGLGDGSAAPLGGGAAAPRGSGAATFGGAFSSPRCMRSDGLAGIIVIRLGCDATDATTTKIKLAWMAGCLLDALQHECTMQRHNPAKSELEPYAAIVVVGHVQP